MSDQQIDELELGREVHNDPTRDGFRRQGRPLTNREMDAARTYLADQRRKANEILEDL